MEAAPANVQQLVRVERIAYRLRFAICLVLLAMTLAFDPAAQWLAALCVLAALAWSVTVVLLLRRPLADAQVVRLGSFSLWLDVTLALATYLVFLPDPAATPVALLPLLVFRLAVRYGRVGAVVAVLAFAALLALRVALNQPSPSGGEVRLAMLLAWLLTAALVLVLALALSTEAGAASPDAPPDPPLANLERPTAPTPVAGYLFQELDEDGDRTRLTRREREVLLLLGAGLTSGGIGCQLGITASTVRNHLHNMREKLQLDNREDLVVLAHQVVAGTTSP